MFARFARYPDYTLYVAELDGSVVGSFSLLLMDNLGRLGTPSAVVEDVIVDASRHRQGIGTAMLRHARRQSALKGCYKMALSSNVRRENAHRFYQSLGFAQHGISFVVAPDDTEKPMD